MNPGTVATAGLADRAIALSELVWMESTEPSDFFPQEEASLTVVKKAICIPKVP